MSAGLDLAVPLRNAILGLPTVTDLLGTYVNEPSVQTRRPAPGEATFPMILISPDVFVADQDALSTFRPVVGRDIGVYGRTVQEGEFGHQDDYRAIEEIGYALREAFHRQREILYVEDYNVIDIVAAGPYPAPTGDDRLIGRVVSLRIRLQRRLNS